MHKAGLLHSEVCEPTCNLGLKWNIFFGGGETNPNHMQIAKWKRQGVVGRERGNGSCNLYKDFGQRSTKPQWKMTALYQWSFKRISVDSLQLVDAVPMLISPLSFHLTFLKKRIVSIYGDGAYGSAFWQVCPLLPAMGKHQLERHLEEQISFMAAVAKLKMPGEHMP